MEKIIHEFNCEIIFEARSKTSGRGLLWGSTLGVQKLFIQPTKLTEKVNTEVPVMARWCRPLSIMRYTSSTIFIVAMVSKSKCIFCFNFFKISYLHISTIWKIQIGPIQMHINNLNESLKVTSQNFL